MGLDPAMAVEVAAMSRQRAIDEATARGDTDVQLFYRHSTFFITGGSGFMGKHMIEKLLRSCQLSKMFVLLRPKKGNNVQERLKNMLEDPVFEPLRKQLPNFEQKIVAVEGDAAELRLGISDQDWETLTNEVEVIYHMAATTRFDEALRIATMINVRGTREVITLGKACKHLKSFVHVSTAYTYALESKADTELYEQFNPTPIPPHALIAMAEEMDADRLNGISNSLIKDWPNTYTFTKAVAEDLVRTMTADMPVCIVRPGVVVAAYREPCPGWVDITCAYGATGLVLGVGLGVMHVILNRYDAKYDLVPCDYVNNVIIAAGKEVEPGSGGENTKIYFISSNNRNPIKQGLLSDIFDTDARKMATPKAVYYNYSLETSNKYIFWIYTWLLHLIPGYCVDFICMILGKEQRFVKIYKKVNKMTLALSYFLINEWRFVDTNLEKLYRNLSKKDKTIFNFDVTDIEWREFAMIWSIGVRKYIVKDGLRDTEYAVKKQLRFKLLHYFVCTIIVFCFYKFFKFLFLNCLGVF